MILELTEERKQAIIENDQCYDGCFFYAVKTTGIFCRPSCKSRVPNFENVTIFSSAEDALKDGYRPCKRCKSGGRTLPDEEWISHVEMYIDMNYAEPLTLAYIAEHCHSSPYHLHRVFKKIKGITPLEYVQNKRMREAEEYLKNSHFTVKKIGELVGISNASRFSTLFKERHGQTPSDFRKGKGNE
ncbi:bifunctional transcriptional activator/DNA repair enzyme AdaA [Corticicoccus populi]|uniref:Bifunctional transcriptional activator/DNA repair enzyme AdaA n=1 Tax=Corticicoccus populi TaxID=1812821 RepID=A0ABW5WVH6_9STAP